MKGFPGRPPKALQTALSDHLQTAAGPGGGESVSRLSPPGRAFSCFRKARQRPPGEEGGPCQATS
jgi:hypothetical protein